MLQTPDLVGPYTAQVCVCEEQVCGNPRIVTNQSKTFTTSPAQNRFKGKLTTESLTLSLKIIDYTSLLYNHRTTFMALMN